LFGCDGLVSFAVSGGDLWLKVPAAGSERTGLPSGGFGTLRGELASASTTFFSLTLLLRSNTGERRSSGAVARFESAGRATPRFPESAPTSCFGEFTAGVPSAPEAGRRSAGGRGTNREVRPLLLSLGPAAGCPASPFAEFSEALPSMLITLRSFCGGRGTCRPNTFAGRPLSCRVLSTFAGFPLSTLAAGRPASFPIGLPRSAFAGVGAFPGVTAMGCVTLLRRSIGGAGFFRISAIVSLSTAIPWLRSMYGCRDSNFSGRSGGVIFVTT
jgi:hypothetical protein